jgi:nucleoside-diphosphate-sugar epimerase
MITYHTNQSQSRQDKGGKAMKVFVAGATGVVGIRSVKLLVSAGHAVTAVARGSHKARALEDVGATPVAVDLFDANSVRGSVVGSDAVINLATKIPSFLRAGVPGAWRENDRIRTFASRNLVDGALAAGASRYIQESFALMYPDRGSDWIDESVVVEPARYVRSAVEAEGQADRFTRAGGVGIVLRFGLFYGPDGSHAVTTSRLARFGAAPILGSPGAFVSPVTSDDAAAAVLSALDAPAGTYNVVDDEPLTRREYVDALARGLGRSSLRTPPSWLTRLGGSKVRMIMRSQRISNRRLKDATGWSPAYPSAREGWPVVVAKARDNLVRSAASV